jgi:uncharacterized protein VirK/YbjX
MAKNGQFKNELEEKETAITLLEHELDTLRKVASQSIEDWHNANKRVQYFKYHYEQMSKKFETVRID